MVLRVEIREGMNKLKEIAMKPGVSPSIVEYIQMQIDREDEERKHGW